MIIKTARLLLRPLNVSDAPALLPTFADADTMRYWAYRPVQSLAEMEQRLCTNISSTGSPTGFAIAQSQDGPALGWVVLYGIKNGDAGAGYILAPSARGCGFVTEAMRGLLNYAFETLKLHRVYLDIDPENSASIRLAQRLSFRWEGHFRENFFRDGEYLDSVFYAILAKEWKIDKKSIF
jgi:RimJ/RimL family protein N-acetyltransferase